MRSLRRSTGCHESVESKPVQFYARADTNASPLRVEVQRHCLCKNCGIFTDIADGENAKDG